jgi:hypothetical protein
MPAVLLLQYFPKAQLALELIVGVDKGSPIKGPHKIILDRLKCHTD